tara:strand:+ start:32956 stop:34050 length:1095 start_codon:yes stop_codon:yes gene_type:complete
MKFVFLMALCCSWLLVGLAVSAGAADESRGDLSAAAPHVSETDDAIVIKVGDRPVLQYNKSNTQPPDGIDPIYARSGYIHPIFSPSGTMVSGHYPADHPHQTGLFNAWVNATFRGHAVDFWNIKKGLGRVAHAKVLRVENHDDRAEFSAELVHEDIHDPQSVVTVLRERWDVVVREAPIGFVIDITSTHRCATDDPLVINEYRYGGMAIRGSGEWYSDQAPGAAKQYAKAIENGEQTETPELQVMGHAFVTSESKDRYDGNHSRPNWIAMYGPSGGNLNGESNGSNACIAILNHESNFRSPQPVRLHPSKPYGCFAPMVAGTFQIKPGEEYVCQYRLIIQDGLPDAKKLDRQWQRFNRISDAKR